MALDFMIRFSLIDFTTIPFISLECPSTSIQGGMPFRLGIEDLGDITAEALAGVPDGEVPGVLHLEWVLETPTLSMAWEWDLSDRWVLA